MIIRTQGEYDYHIRLAITTKAMISIEKYPMIIKIKEPNKRKMNGELAIIPIFNEIIKSKLKKTWKAYASPSAARNDSKHRATCLANRKKRKKRIKHR